MNSTEFVVWASSQPCLHRNTPPSDEEWSEMRSRLRDALASEVKRRLMLPAPSTQNRNKIQKWIA